jgi:N-acetylgalactosamine kinase
VPHDLFAKLQSVYGSSPEGASLHAARYNGLQGKFRAEFPQYRARFFVRAPGRVNLIGEHTDYNGYPVMPMALDRDIVFAMAPSGDATVELVNEEQRFGRRSFAARFPVTPYKQGNWGNYVKAAVHGLLEAGLVSKSNTIGFRAVVGGTIPESAGLSSSSAMVVAAALAFLTANNAQFDRKTLADVLAHAERYVGSEGGGMDQAISLLAKSDHALRIDFFPLRTELVPLRKELTFVVCNSLIRAPKSESVRYAYNRRVVECRLATALLANAIGQRMGKTIKATRLSELSGEQIGLKPDELHGIADQAIGEKPLMLKVIAERLGTTPEQVQRVYCMQSDGTPLAEPQDGFKIWNRYKHVVTEAERVGSTVKACRSGDIAEVGALMNQSHASCRDDYELSCPELEALVSIARERGALGARLTGAGFGGCSVNVVPSEEAEQFIHAMTVDYYEGYVKREKGRDFTGYRDLRDVLFPCRASMGAGYWPVAEFIG